MVQRKITVNILDKPLTGKKIDEYAAKKKVKVSKFSDNTWLVGEIYFGKRFHGILGLEKETWPDYQSFHPNFDIINRMTIKMFDKAGKIIGKIEERLIKELAIHGMSGKLPVFTAALQTYPYMIDLERESEKLVFSMLSSKTRGMLDIFQISKKSFAIRSNFTIKRKFWNQRIAFIDSKRGGKIEIKIYDDILSHNENFLNFLVLFASTIKYHDEIGDKVHGVCKELADSTLIVKPTKQALSMIKKPSKEELTKKDEETLLIFREKVEPEIEREEVLPSTGLLEAEERKKGKKEIKKKKKVEKPYKKEKPKKIPKEAKIKKVKEGKPPKVVEVEPPPKKKDLEKPLFLEDPVTEVIGVTEDISTLLESVGIYIVDDLLFVDPNVIAENLDEKSITPARIEQWQTISQQRIETTLKREKERRDKFLEKYETREREDRPYY